MTLSYLCYVFQAGCQWALRATDYVNDLDPRVIGISTFFGNESNRAIFMRTVADSALGALADGLMVRYPYELSGRILYRTFNLPDLQIWRCFNVWGRSFHVILLPLALLLCEIGTYNKVSKY